MKYLENINNARRNLQDNADEGRGLAIDVNTSQELAENMVLNRELECRGSIAKKLK